MDRKYTNIKERVLYFSKNQGISIEKFLLSIGMTYGSFKGKALKGTLNSKAIEEIYTKYSEINIEWLITGIGDMIKYNKPVISVLLDNEVPKGAVPFYNLPVSAGQSLFEIEGSLKPDGYIKDIPSLKNTEAVLPVQGYSMQPEIKEGALIGIRKANNWDSLNTERKYLIITRDDRMVKYIEHDESNNDILWCVSPNYKRFKILKEEIIDVFRVTFVMNPE